MDPPFHCDAEGCTNPATRRLGECGDLFVCDDHDPTPPIFRDAWNRRRVRHWKGDDDE